MVDLRDDRGVVLLAPTQRGGTMRPFVWVAAVRAHALRGDCLSIATSPHGFPYLVLTDDFGEVLATGPIFGSVDDCSRVMHILRNTIGAAPVVHVADAIPPGTMEDSMVARVRRRHLRPPKSGRVLAVFEDRPVLRPPALAAGTQPSGRFLIHGAEYVSLESSGGDLLLRSARLEGPRACIEAIEILRRHAALDDQCERYMTPYKGHAFAICGEDRSTLARSPVFASPSGREQALAMVRVVAPIAPLTDAGN